MPDLPDDLRETLRRIEADGKDRGDKLDTMGTQLTELKTVILGTATQPDIGLVAQVSENRKRIGRMERFLMLGGGAGILGGGTTAAYWNTLKAMMGWHG